jgi:pyruvate dehydrogenase E2 component (dihydrolipoamide acetyltransferase)
MTSDTWVVTMPKLGETVTEGTVSAWLKQVGEEVAFDDPLFEVSTDKVDSEIPSPYDGTVLQILVAAGQTVPVGTVLARIGTPGAPAVPTSTSPRARPAAAAPVASGATPAAEPESVLSPVVRRLAAEHGLDLQSIRGSGAGGRITRADVQAEVARTASGSGNGYGNGSGPGAPAAPAVRPAPAVTIPPAPTPGPAAPSPSTLDPRDDVVPLSRMRLLTADLMVKSLNTSAHVWTSIEVDFEAIEQVRRRHKERFKNETGASLSYLPFIGRALCDALRAYPAVNSSIDIAAKTMTRHPYVNLGIAVDLDEQGLLVPVVKDADGLNLRGLASKIASMAAAARARKLGMPDLSGSTFTITNPGPFSSYASSPVINQPNVAILCTDGVTRKPVAVGDAIAIHSVGIIGLAYDHRAFDGSTASKFLLHLRDLLQNRDWEAEVS